MKKFVDPIIDPVEVQWYREEEYWNEDLFPVIKSAWILMAFIGTALLIGSFL